MVAGRERVIVVVVVGVDVDVDVVVDVVVVVVVDVVVVLGCAEAFRSDGPRLPDHEAEVLGSVASPTRFTLEPSDFARRGDASLNRTPPPRSSRLVRRRNAVGVRNNRATPLLEIGDDPDSLTVWVSLRDGLLHSEIGCRAAVSADALIGRGREIGDDPDRLTIWVSPKDRCVQSEAGCRAGVSADALIGGASSSLLQHRARTGLTLARS